MERIEIGKLQEPMTGQLAARHTRTKFLRRDGTASGCSASEVIETDARGRGYEGNGKQLPPWVVLHTE
jgi:hypothetical protein